jgi:hypothetical protein
MTPNRWAVLAAVTATTISVIIVLGWTTGWINHRPLHRHLIPLPTPAPADHGWITPSQPTP